MHKVRFTFEWDEEKNRINIEKHQVSFYKAQEVFYDLNRIILKDIEHSNNEDRFFCLGKVEQHILTVRFTIRGYSRSFALSIFSGSIHQILSYLSRSYLWLPANGFVILITITPSFKPISSTAKLLYSIRILGAGYWRKGRKIYDKENQVYKR